MCPPTAVDLSVRCFVVLGAREDEQAGDAVLLQRGGGRPGGDAGEGEQLGAEREAAVVVAVDHDRGGVGEAELLEGGEQAGERAVEVVHAVEVVAERAALERAELEALERVREMVVGVVQAEGDEEGEEGPREGGELGQHALEEGVVGEAPADDLAGAEVLAEQRAREAVARVEDGAVPEALLVGVGGEGAVAGGRAGRGRGCGSGCRRAGRRRRPGRAGAGS
jgi:hypothetical protein